MYFDEIILPGHLCEDENSGALLLQLRQQLVQHVNLGRVLHNTEKTFRVDLSHLLVYVVNVARTDYRYPNQNTEPDHTMTITSFADPLHFDTASGPLIRFVGKRIRIPTKKRKKDRSRFVLLKRIRMCNNKHCLKIIAYIFDSKVP